MGGWGMERQQEGRQAAGRRAAGQAPQVGIAAPTGCPPCLQAQPHAASPEHQEEREGKGRQCKRLAAADLERVAHFRCPAGLRKRHGREQQLHRTPCAAGPLRTRCHRSACMPGRHPPRRPPSTCSRTHLSKRVISGNARAEGEFKQERRCQPPHHAALRHAQHVPAVAPRGAVRRPARKVKHRAKMPVGGGRAGGVLALVSQTDQSKRPSLTHLRLSSLNGSLSRPGTSSTASSLAPCARARRAWGGASESAWRRCMAAP